MTPPTPIQAREIPQHIIVIPESLIVGIVRAGRGAGFSTPTSTAASTAPCARSASRATGPAEDPFVEPGHRVYEEVSLGIYTACAALAAPEAGGTV